MTFSAPLPPVVYEVPPTWGTGLPRFLTAQQAVSEARRLTGTCGSLQFSIRDCRPFFMSHQHDDGVGVYHDEPLLSFEAVGWCPITRTMLKTYSERL